MKVLHLLPLAAIACGTIVAVDGDPQTPARIVIESTGGIAALRMTTVVDSATATVTREMCSLGVPAAECGARGQRDVVIAQRGDVSRLFALTASAEFRALRSDYGTSTQGADLMGYVVTVSGNAGTRTIRADDITRPELLARLFAELNALGR